MKDRANQRKHAVSFQEARSVLDDRFVSVEEDFIRSGHDRRYRVLGTSIEGRLLVVAVVTTGVDTARIISARRPTKGERHAYEDR